MASPKIVVRLLHVSTLLFSAWWLIATSAPPIPQRNCFTGIGQKARLRVVLGAIKTETEPTPTPTTTPTPPTPGCAGIDGLRPGSVLIFDLLQGTRGYGGPNSCYGYETRRLEGSPEVAVGSSTTARYGYAEHALTSVQGSYSSTQWVGCRASYWAVDLLPATPPPPGAVISPLDAGAQQPWFVERWMNVNQAQFCEGGAFAVRGEISCADSFSVESIALEPAL